MRTKVRVSPSGRSAKPSDFAPVPVSTPSVVGSSNGSRFDIFPVGAGAGTVAAGDDPRFGEFQSVRENGTTQTIRTVAPPDSARVTNELLNLGQNLIGQPPIPGVICVVRAKDCLPQISNAALAGLCRTRIGKRAAIQPDVTIAPALTDAFNGRQSLFFTPTVLLNSTMQMQDLGAFFTRLNDASNNSLTVYARYRHITTGNTIQTICGAKGALSCYFGILNDQPFIGANGNTSFTSILPGGATGTAASYCWSGTAQAFKFRRDGVAPVSNTISAAHDTKTTAALGNNEGVGTVRSNTNAQGYLESIAFIEGELSDAQYLALDRWMTSDYSRVLLLEGNSISIGSTTYACCGGHMERAMGPTTRVENYGIGGQTTAQILAAMGARSLARIDASKPSVCCLWEFSNSILAGATLVTLQGYVTTYLSAVAAVGGLPLLGTVLPRTDIAGPAETVRTQFNAWLVGAYPDITADPAAIPQLQTASDAVYYVDGVHPTEYGGAIVGAEFARVAEQYQS